MRYRLFGVPVRVCECGWEVDVENRLLKGVANHALEFALGAIVAFERLTGTVVPIPMHYEGPYQTRCRGRAQTAKS